MRIVLCDTNRKDLEGYSKLCLAICEKKQFPVSLTTFSAGNALLFEMSERAFFSLVSILILEPDAGCEEVAAAVRQYGYDGIILYLSRSAELQYFYQAFDAKAYSYVQKGDLNRFSAVFESALDSARQLEGQYIAVSCAGEYRQIDVRDIYFFETAMDHMVRVWYAGGNFVFPSSLSDLEKRLGEYGFLRVHRSYLVSVGAVHRISFKEVVLNNGQAIPISRGNFPLLKNALDKLR